MNTVRQYPMSKPAGHKPALQRYSSVPPDDVTTLRLLVLGAQWEPDAPAPGDAFLDTVHTLFAHEQGPDNHDFARYTDPQGCANRFAVAYWQRPERFEAWRESFAAWWGAHDPSALDCGYWLETFGVPVVHSETIAFKEYIRGLSACPRSRIEPMDESGYWGAARDRIPASAWDDFAPPGPDSLTEVCGRSTRGRRVRVATPRNLSVIRSGVSWEACGEEQLQSYNRNVRPKLNAGMDYLRAHPIESGCASLRQVECLAADGIDIPEAYTLGYFLSLGHLERWSKEHPTHLAIYHRAQAERKKYQERLELRTYHEVYVLGDDCTFEYLNCHERTGLLPFFPDA